MYIHTCRDICVHTYNICADTQIYIPTHRDTCMHTYLYNRHIHTLPYTMCVYAQTYKHTHTTVTHMHAHRHKHSCTSPYHKHKTMVILSQDTLAVEDCPFIYQHLRI